MMQAGKRCVQDMKHVMECRNHKAQCGSMLPLEAVSICPLSVDQRRQIGAARRCASAPAADAATALTVTPVRLPMLQAAQPSKILMHEVSQARQARRVSGCSGAHAADGTLTDLQMQRLHHAFVCLAGSDGMDHALPATKLHELLVVANMDGTQASTAALVAKLVRNHLLRCIVCAQIGCSWAA